MKKKEPYQMQSMAYIRKLLHNHNQNQNQNQKEDPSSAMKEDRKERRELP